METPIKPGYDKPNTQSKILGLKKYNLGLWCSKTETFKKDDITFKPLSSYVICILIALVNVYVDLVVFTRIAGTS